MSSDHRAHPSQPDHADHADRHHARPHAQRPPREPQAPLDARLTPQSARLLKQIALLRRPRLHQLGAARARALYNQAAEVLDLPRVAMAQVLDAALPGGDGAPRPVRVYRPMAATTPQPALLYLHGGGFVLGGLETHDASCRQLAQRSGLPVVALDYRLAPEHPFPAAVDDTVAALGALVQGAGSAWGLNGQRLAVGGDSAGATLAAVTAITARDRGWPLALQLLITPGTAPEQDSDSHRRYARGYVIDAELLAWFFGQYASAAQRHDWRFAPLLADDLDGVAPACVILAECDPLVDEALAYADRLRMAGVPVELDLVRGVTHDFIKFGRVIPQAAPALDFAAGALRRALVNG